MGFKSVEKFVKDKLNDKSKEQDCESCGLRYEEMKHCGGYYGCLKIRLNKKLEKEQATDEEKADAAKLKYELRKKELEKAIEEMKIAHSCGISTCSEKLAISAKEKLDCLFNKGGTIDESEETNAKAHKETTDKKEQHTLRESSNMVTSSAEALNEKKALLKEKLILEGEALNEGEALDEKKDLLIEKPALSKNDALNKKEASDENGILLEEKIALDIDKTLNEGEALDEKIDLLKETLDLTAEVLNKSKIEMIDRPEETAEAVSGLGKFKSAGELLRAYNALESEFTKRCQRLKTLAKENEILKGAQAELPLAANEPLTVSQTETDGCGCTDDSGAFGGNIARAQIAGLKNSHIAADLQTAKMSADALNEQFMHLLEDEEFLDSQILHNPKIRAKIISGYLRSLEEKQSVQVLAGSYGRAALQPQLKPKTLEEAKRLTGMLFF